MNEMYIGMGWLVLPGVVVAITCAYLIVSMIRADKI